MKSNSASRGKNAGRVAPKRKTFPNKTTFVRKTTKKTTNGRRTNKRKKTVLSTKTIGIITAVLVFCLMVTILCTQVFKKDIDRMLAKKYTVTDIDGSQRKLTSDELEEEVRSDRFYQGISVDGVDLSGKTLDEAKAMFAEIRGQQVEEMVDIKFQVGNEEVSLNADGFHISSNIDEVLNEAYDYAKSSPLEGGEGLVDRYTKITDLKKTPKNFESVFTIGDDNISTLTHSALDAYNLGAIEAKATGFDVSELQFIIEESHPGQTVDIDKAIEDVKSAFAAKEYKKVIPVAVTMVEPKTTAESLREKLGKVSSNGSKTKDDANRNTNISLICKKLNGLVLQPGEQFDFNAYIGERTPEKGFKEATGISDGTTRLEYGGGICQANTMLYHSVIEAGLQVDKRVPHSWASDYVDVGTDATVTWDGANFKFTNNTDYPIAIHAVYGDCWVTVEIFGRRLPDGQKIKFFGTEYITNEEPDGEEYEADPTLAVGKKERDRKPHNHILCKAFIVTYDADGNEISRKEVLTEYRAIKAKYRVGTLGPDGTIYNLDTKTGEVSPPAGYTQPTQPTQPSETTPEATQPSETPSSSESQAPAETPSEPAD